MRAQFGRRFALVIGIALLVTLAAACRSSSTKSPAATGQAPGSATGQALTASAPGVTASEIIIGSNGPLTGPAAGYATWNKGMQAYFDYVNANGGVHGRKIVYKYYDDGFDPSRTVGVMQRLVNQDHAFAVSCLGTAPCSSVYKTLDDQQVPIVGIGSGSSIFVNPVRKYVFPFLQSYRWENDVLAQYAKETYPGARIGLLYQNDSAGKDFFESWTRIAGPSIAKVTTYDVGDPSVTSQVQALKNSGATLVAFNGTIKYPPLLMRAIADLGWKVPVISTGEAIDPTITIPASGSAAEGLITVEPMPLYNDYSNEYVRQFHDIQQKYAPAAEWSSFTLVGMATAYFIVEGLKAAGPSLTRDGFVKALEGTKGLKGPWYGTATLSATQHRALNCEGFLKVENGKFVPFGKVVCRAQAGAGG